MQQNNSLKHDVIFIPLRVHSSYSLLSSTLKIDKIIEYAVANNIPAVGLTDINNLFGIFEFSQKAIKAGVQPIVGCQINCFYSKENSLYEGDIVLLAKDKIGYENLLYLVSLMYISNSPNVGQKEVSLNIEQLANKTEGLIMLTGGETSIINNCLQSNNITAAKELLQLFMASFPNNLYVELQRYQGYNKHIEKELINLAYGNALPLVATNNSYFMYANDYEAHDALLAIADGQLLANTNRRRVTEDHSMKSAKDMLELFSDLPEALSNSVEIAYRCHIFTESKPPLLPRFISSAEEDNSNILDLEASELARQAKEGLEQRLAVIGCAEGYTKKDYEERLSYELSIINKMQFPGYFLIVADFIQWAKKHSIPVGPGRGSGAGSLVAYALTITNIDPLRFSLLFERFLNPDRVSMPDFDIDFCQDRRGEVIQYVQQRYGSDHVAQIITFGSLQARAVIRDVGRVLEIPYGQVDRLSKLIPNNPAHPVTLAQAVKDEPALRKEKSDDPKVAKLLEIAQKLEGLYRHASVHAAGIVIGDRPLSKLVPLYKDVRSDMNVTQFNMKFVEQAGLVKFDFLGLKTLTVLQNTVSLIEKQGKIINLDTIPLDDKKTYEMLARGETVGVFQLESAGMRKALIGMKPDCIEDIIALLALYRPGPMENIPLYNARKNGQQQIASVHPKIDYLLKETQGVIVYQEQVMQIAQVLSGYSLGEADLLRRAMGKKIASEMEQQRARFVQGAQENDVSETQANDIFNLLAKFADYGFNKSHAAAYAYVSYQTAYLKAHYPAEFLATSLTYDMSNADKVNDYLNEAKRLKIEIIFPCVQTSMVNFSVEDGKIIYALSALKGVGEAAAEHIVQCRGNQKFSDINDFCKRVNSKYINKRVLESLIYSGAFDCFGIDREILLNGVETMQAYSMRMQEATTLGQQSLFSLDDDFKDELIFPKLDSHWSTSDKLQKEFQVLGFYLSSHPLELYGDLLKKQKVALTANVIEKGERRAKVAGTIIAKQERKTKNGNKMGIITFTDTSGQFEASLFSESLENYRELLEVGRSNIFEINIQRNADSDSSDIRIEKVISLTDVKAKELLITLNHTGSLMDIKNMLSTADNGHMDIIFIVKKDAEWKEVTIKTNHKTKITMDNLERLTSFTGVEAIKLN